MEDLRRTEALIKAARIYAAEQVGWFAPALYAAPLILTELIPSIAAIDRWGRVYFNSSWVNQVLVALEGDVVTAREMLGFVWYHEVSHWLREHADRADEINAHPFLWNLAADMELNDYVPPGLSMLEIEGLFQLVTPQLYELPDGQIAEWYYRQLLRSGSQDSRRTGPMSFNSWDEGSGVHAQEREWEVSPQDDKVHQLDDFDRLYIQEVVANSIKEHQKNQGALPAGWTRWAEEVYKSKVNWREKLKRIVRGAVCEGFGHRLDYSYRRPHRRSSVYSPIIIPVLSGEYRPRVTVVVDTSGSIGKEELCQALSEAFHVLNQLKVPVTLIPCDSTAYEAIRISNQRDWEVAQQNMRGGGGTNMIAGLNAALQQKPKPDAVLVLTDGYTPFPDTPPKETKVIWGIWKLGEKDPPLPGFPWSGKEVVVIPMSVN